MTKKTYETTTLLPVEQVAKGDFFRRPGKSVVYTMDGYCRTTKRYCGTQYMDICAQTYIKKGRIVEVGFTY